MGVRRDAGGVDLVNAAVITVDLEGRITSANPYVEQLYGWAPGDLVGREAGELAVIAVDADVQEEIAWAITHGGSWEGVFEVRRKDGSTVTVRALDIPLHDETGNLAGILSVGFDASHERDMVRRLDEQTRIAEMFKFLAECTTTLSSALDYGQALQRLGRLSADFIGDVCLIDIIESGTVRRMAAAHRDPAAQHLVDELVNYMPDPSGSHPAVQALEKGTSTYAETMSEVFLRETTRDDRHLALVEELGFESYMCVPLTARGRILGALTLVSCDPARPFTTDDLNLAHELAWRAALALDNARLFEERSRVARVLQASLLPPSLPHIEGAELAATYVAAEEGLDVGGDFYDVFDAGYRAWAVSIGDVCGRGPRAATVTGLIRHTVRSLAFRERDPGRLLHALNAVLHRDLADPALFSTVWYAMVRSRPDGLVLRFANGGHPPPLVLHADASISEIVTDGLVLGSFETGDWPAATVTLRPGETAVLYTVGVSEARYGDVQFGDAAFRETLAALAGADPQTIADAVTAAASDFASGAVPDDMAVLVIQATPRPLAQ